MPFTVSNSMDDQNATSANINPNNKNTMTTTKTENTVTESGMEFHAYALLFPQAGDDVLNSMAADIGKNGLREAITTFEDKILDGRNRYLACQKAGVEPRFDEYEENDPLGFVLSKNASRRHLRTSQRAIIAARLSGERKSEGTNPQICGLLTQVEAAAAMGISEKQVQNAARLFREGTAELIASVERGDIAIHAALEEIKTSKPKAAPSAKKENRKQVEQDNAAEMNDELPTLPAEEQEEQGSDDDDNNDDNDDLQAAHKQVEASPTLSEEVLKQIRDVLRPFGDDEKKLANLFVDVVQDMAGEFIKDKYREKFLRGVKAVLREFGV